METITKKSWLKIAGMTLALSSFVLVANAQKATPGAQTTITNKAAVTGVTGTGAADGGAVRLVDNKGTIKYLQVENGITQITKATTSGVTTTWQLGGTLTDNTYITAGANKEFALDGLELVPSTGASTNAVTRESHGAVGSGWTVLVRDEATGAIKKMLATELLQVQAGHEAFDAAVGQTTFTTTFAVALPTDVSKVSVYRNGAKLLVGTDYTVSGAIVTLNPVDDAAGNADWAVLAGDKIEVQWIR